MGDYKGHRVHGVQTGLTPILGFGLPAPKGPWLFDLARDPDESYDISQVHPERLGALLREMEAWDREMVDNPKGWKR